MKSKHHDMSREPDWMQPNAPDGRALYEIADIDPSWVNDDGTRAAMIIKFESDDGTFALFCTYSSENEKAIAAGERQFMCVCRDTKMTPKMKEKFPNNWYFDEEVREYFAKKALGKKIELELKTSGKYQNIIDSAPVGGKVKTEKPVEDDDDDD